LADVANLAGLSRRAVSDIERNAGKVANFAAIEKHIPISVTGLPTAGTTIGERLRLARMVKPMSLRDAASRANLSVNTVREIESGRGTLGPLLKLARVVAPQARAKAIRNASNRRGLAVVGWRADLERHRADYYPTPAPIVRLLLDHEHFDRAKTVLEPTVGKARIIEQVLRERGFENVVCFDLHAEGAERRDFFDIAEPYHTIITNPPFRMHREFITHAKKIATHKIALLLPLNYLSGAARHAALWTDSKFPLARVHVLNRGINFLSSDPHADVFDTSQMYCCWFVFDRSHRGAPTLHWIDSHRHVARKRDERVV
jgi:transcriptional regulator with XRE-family HTH domain